MKSSIKIIFLRVTHWFFENGKKNKHKNVPNNTISALKEKCFAILENLPKEISRKVAQTSAIIFCDEGTFKILQKRIFQKLQNAKAY